MSLESHEHHPPTPEPLERRGLPEPLFTAEGVPVYPIKAVAELTGVYWTQVYKLGKAGRIRTAKPGNELFVNLDDVRTYKENPKDKGGRRKRLAPEHPTTPPAV